MLMMMKKCCLPLLGLGLVLGSASTAQAQLGACANPADGTVCLLNQSDATCAAQWGGTGVYQGKGTTGCRDCDCDGDHDAAEVEACIVLCMGTPINGTRPECMAICSSGGADGLPNKCPASNIDVPGADWCCNQADGSKLDYTDGIACTPDVCNPDGSIDNTPTAADDATCAAAHVEVCSETFCNRTPNDGVWGDGCTRDIQAAGAACVGDGVTACSLADTCDGTLGGCLDNFTAQFTTCGPGTECSVDQCNGAGTCVNWVGSLNGTACTDDGSDCTDDVCAATVCTHPALPGGTACGDQDATDCNAPDTCGINANAGVCMPRFKASTVVCRAADASGCDKKDNCTGASAVCPADGKRAAGFLCGNGNGFSDICDKQDTCDGAGVCTNNVWPAGTACRKDSDGAAGCDAADVCDGTTDACPDLNESAGTACGSATDTTCTNPDTCNANGVCKPRNEPDGTDCDVWPDDCFVSTCAAGACSSHVPQPEFTDCGGPPTGKPCDEQDTCNDAGGCVDRLVPAGTECRGVAAGKDGQCDVPESCTGNHKACPVDGFATAGTACDNNNACNEGDACNGSGACSWWTNLVDCDDGKKCTADSCDPATGCINSYKNGASGVGGCSQNLLVKHVIVNDNPASKHTNGPGVFEKGCFRIEVYAMDASVNKGGLNCVYLDLDLGINGSDCPLSVMDLADQIQGGSDYQVFVEDTFSEFQSWWVDPPSGVLNFGGCTLTPGVGVQEWVLVGTIDVIAPQDECKAHMEVAQSEFTDSSLFDQKPGKKGFAFRVWDETDRFVSTDCWGHIYDHWANNDFVNASDLSMFATCWNMGGPGCSEFDYDMNGKVDKQDLSFFATAWQEFVCAGGIVIPVQQLNCGDFNPFPQSAGAGVTLGEAGDFVPVILEPATDEMILSFGLPLPVDTEPAQKQRAGAARGRVSGR